METMTIATNCGIRIAGKDGFAVDALRVTIIGMAGRAFLDHPDLIPFPWSHLMNVFMAVFTLNIIDEVGTCIMFRTFLFMASMTSDGLRMNSYTFSF
jgi:hypothetical protein